MGASRHDRGRSTTATADEFDHAALIERIEFLETDLEAVKGERERLKTELVVAQCWVRELATWVEENAPPSGAVAREWSRRGEKPLGSFGLPFPATPAAPPVDWRAATPALIVLFAPWLLLGLVVYIAYALL